MKGDIVRLLITAIPQSRPYVDYWTVGPREDNYQLELNYAAKRRVDCKQELPCMLSKSSRTLSLSIFVCLKRKQHQPFSDRDRDSNSDIDHDGRAVDRAWIQS